MIIAYFSGLVVVLVGGMSCDRWSDTNIIIHLPPCICIQSSFQCCRSYNTRLLNGLILDAMEMLLIFPCDSALISS